MEIFSDVAVESRFGCRTPGWHQVYHSYFVSLGFDVYDDRRSQTYDVDTEVTSTTNAINAVGGLGMHTLTTNKIFPSEYYAGTENSPGTSGYKVSQWGTEYFARQGKTYDYMLHYYYDTSTLLEGEKVGYFTY